MTIISIGQGKNLPRATIEAGSKLLLQGYRSQSLHRTDALAPFLSSTVHPSIDPELFIRMPLGGLSALRETSVIFATLIGFFVLKAENWKRRLGAAMLMVFGIAFIALNA
jgi:hypothetical protein